MQIFKDVAQKYWDAGLQAIPLAPGQKRPIPQQWQQWTNNPITPTIKQNWVDSYPSANIGVVPGPVSNVCFVDLDIADPVVLAEIEKQLPPSPWRRVGKKGCVLAYKWSDAKSFKIFEAEGTHPGRDKFGFEFFSSSGQVVMPPSIHPDTQQPYTANCNLWDVIDQLVEIDGHNLEKKMRDFFGIKKLKVQTKGRVLLGGVASRGTRDVTMIKLAGLYAQMVRRGECTLKAALDYMDVWGSEFVEDVAGDSLDINKGKLKIVEYLVKDVHDRKVVLPKGWDAGLDEVTKTELDLGRITEDDVSFDYGQILDEFNERLVEIQTEGDDVHGLKKNEAIKKAMMRTARSTSVSELEVDGVFQHVQNQVGKNIKVASLRKLMKEQESQALEGISHSEIAEDFIKNNNDIEMRHDRGILWEWMGSYWGKKNREQVLRTIIENYGKLPAAKKHSDHKGIMQTVCALLTKPIKTANGYGINFTNGYLDTDLRLQPHSKENGLIYELPYTYKPDLEDPKMFLDFIRSVWPDDPEMIDLVQEALAVTLFGIAPKFQRCFLLYGVAHSGKSVMMEILSSLFPPEAQCAVPPHRWNERFMLGQLDGPVLNLAGELPETQDISSQIFKQAVNGETLTAEIIYRGPFQFKPVAANWFASNHLPRTKDTSIGFTRRWMIMPFLHAVPEEKRNMNLAEDIITNEREAIVAWAVRAIQRVMTRGHLTVPKTAAAMNNELGSLLNSVRIWFNERTECGTTTELTDEAAYMSYTTFILQKGFKKLDRGLFRATMREMAGDGSFQAIAKPDGSQVFRGLKIKKIGQSAA